MAKTIKVKSEEKGEISIIPFITNIEPLAKDKTRIDIIAHEFGNGDMNIIRDKVNEIIKSIN